MPDDQYSVFRDIDRRCVAGGLKDDECREAVRLKRASIESEMMRTNPIVHDVMAGSTTFVMVYDEFSRAFRGFRRLGPMAHDEAWNERLRHFSAVVPNVKHFTRRSLFAADNPLNWILYSQVAATAIGIIGSRSAEDDVDPGMVETSFVSARLVLAVVFAFAGFVVGTVSMLKYRTRDPKVIHAREAAAYMDLNYAFYRAGNDAAWNEFIRLQGGGVGGAPRRPRDNS